MPKSTATNKNPPLNGNGNAQPPAGERSTAETTGRFIVTFKEGAGQQGIQSLAQAAGINTLNALDAGEDSIAGASVFFEHLDIAVVQGEPGQMGSLGIANETSPILAIEPERIVQAIGTEVNLPDYLSGYRDAIKNLTDDVLGFRTSVKLEELSDALLDEALNTWGLQVSAVVNSPYTGKGIKIAVLDTGFDLNHPDFVGRAVVAQSFIPGQVVQDGHGHGTHCIGTAAGPRVSGIAPRYGIAHEASIFAGKVLSNQGSGGDGSILAGINWALMNKCQVISMSLGAVVPPNAPFSVAYEQAARRALKAGSLIIAAAGNNGGQPVNNTVGHPANCPSIMAVAALELRPGDALNVSIFSAQGVVDIAGPGRNVRSSWPMPNRYNTISGTSMATPHVAGIAALHAQATGATGYALWAIVSTAAKRLSLPSAHVGVGLVQAPVVAPI